MTPPALGLATTVAVRVVGVTELTVRVRPVPCGARYGLFVLEIGIILPQLAEVLLSAHSVKSVTHVFDVDNLVVVPRGVSELLIGHGVVLVVAVDLEDPRACEWYVSPRNIDSPLHPPAPPRKNEYDVGGS